MAEAAYDLTIIGGGPTGLFAAFYAGLRGMRTKLIEALPELGGQCIALYPEKDIFDVAGFPKVMAKDLVDGLVEQAMRFSPTICLDERVEQLRVGEGEAPHSLVTNHAEHVSRLVLITAGVGAFSPRTLGQPEVESFVGRGVDYYIKDLEQLRNRRVLVVGGGDSAVDWAMAAIERASEVTLVHRRDEFRAHEENVRRLMDSEVRVKTPYELRSLAGNGVVESALIRDNRTQESEAVVVDRVILSLGFKAELGPLASWGLALDKGGIQVDIFGRTNLTRVYAAGDICSHPAKLNLIATGFAEAATAVNFAVTEIDAAARAFPGHSTELLKKSSSIVRS